METYGQKRYKELVATGICTKCGKVPKDDTRMCNKCRNELNQYKRDTYRILHGIPLGVAKYDRRWRYITQLAEENAQRIQDGKTTNIPR